MPVYFHEALPSAYQEVEYIQSSGTQYINTGLNITDGYRQVQKIMFFTTQTNNIISGGYLGQYSTGRYRRFYFCGPSSNGKWTRGYLGDGNGEPGHQNIGSGSINVDYVLDISWISGNAYCKVDNTVLMSSSSTRSSSAAGQCILFGGYADDLSPKIYSYAGGVRIYYSKFYNKDGTLIRDFVPCYRKSDNVIGMYDLVTNQFYTNSGTGTFTKGSNVSNSHTIECLSRLYKGSDLLVGGKCTPGHELLAYFPFKNDINDVMGNVNLATVLSGQSVTYSKSSIGYEFVVGYNDNDILIGNASNGMYNARTMSVRLQRISDSSGSYGGKVSSPMLFGANYCFRHWQTNPNNAREICDLSNCTFGQHEYLSKNTWYNIIITYNGTTFVCYLNGNNRCSANRGMYIDPNTGMCHSILRGGTLIYSELLYDKVMWDSNEATAYYNNTKSQYGL